MTRNDCQDAVTYSELTTSFTLSEVTIKAGLGLPLYYLCRACFNGIPNGCLDWLCQAFTCPPFKRKSSHTHLSVLRSCSRWTQCPSETSSRRPPAVNCSRRFPDFRYSYSHRRRPNQTRSSTDPHSQEIARRSATYAAMSFSTCYDNGS